MRLSGWYTNLSDEGTGIYVVEECSQFSASLQMPKLYVGMLRSDLSGNLFLEATSSEACTCAVFGLFEEDPT